MGKEQRIKAGLRAREFKAHGFVLGEGPDLLDPAFWQDLEPKYNHFKEELYGLMAVFSDGVLKEAWERREKNPPFGLTKPIEGNFMGWTEPVTAEHLFPPLRFENLGNYMRSNLIRVAKDEADKIKNTKAEPEITSIYKRVEDILAFLDEHVPGYVQPDPLVFLNRGINTATDVASGFFQMVDFLGDKSDPEQLIADMRDSWALAVEFGLGDRVQVKDAIHSLQELPFPDISMLWPFQPKYFRLGRREGEKGLQLSKKGIKRLKAANIDPDFGANLDSTVMCLGMINLGDRSGAKIMWDWYLDIAKNLYLPQQG